ncbi:alpha/beta fold hydrolase [Idiomarina aminovorans]|uniref:alpha/beta fold hydrolase n=1 Tax=Idiomarina aminovorans TaxID=2914829 RepID=UPI002003C328|nr:YqiA/YcfP family alpha/beta fold hydrolase [Idiomarina sp. ATCH4]MCK7458670.1 alpha/beta hydrolase [Idiomarina sp. ATCH4]
MQVIFNHGKESGPWGTKIKVLAKSANDLGMQVNSIDYQGMSDPDTRVEKLLEYVKPLSEPFLLVGSSMGGYVATVAAEQKVCKGLFLMAPAFYLGGQADFDAITPECKIQIVHGWRDTIVPVENSWRYAKRTHSQLDVLDDDHRLVDSLDQTNALFKEFLQTY